MKAVTYQGIKNVVVKEVPDPKIEKPDDMIVKITSTAICGSDLHLIHGMIPNLQENYVIGHEPMGIVEEVGPGVTKVKKGDRVIIPFNIACGECFFAKISWKANVTIQTNTGIWAHISATRNDRRIPWRASRVFTSPVRKFYPLQDSRKLRTTGRKAKLDRRCHDDGILERR